MRSSNIRQLVLQHLPLIVFLTPVVTVNLAYIVASALDHIPDCIPYLSGCTSISSTGRVMPQQGIFLLGMIPTAIWTMLFWTTAEKQLTEKTPQHQHRTLLFFGAIASVFLIVYVTTLGIPGTVYTLLRKFAVLIYFGFTYIAQLLVIKRLLLVAIDTGDELLMQTATRLKWFCVGVMAFGILIVPISLIEDPIRRKEIENMIEWNYALLIYLYFLLLYPLWRERQTGSVDALVKV